MSKDKNQDRVELDGCTGCGCMIFSVLLFIAACAVCVKVIRWGFFS